jgi:hypothetical protein
LVSAREKRGGRGKRERGGEKKKKKKNVAARRLVEERTGPHQSKVFSKKSENHPEDEFCYSGDHLFVDSVDLTISAGRKSR